jgi:hypothetical protein
MTRRSAVGALAGWLALGLLPARAAAPVPYPDPLPPLVPPPSVAAPSYLAPVPTTPQAPPPVLSAADLVAVYNPGPVSVPGPFLAPGLAPPMIGDFTARFAAVSTARTILVTVPAVPPRTPRRVLPVRFTAVVKKPVALGSPFKIADNESPIPLDRVFGTFAYFDNLARGLSSFSSPTNLPPPPGTRVTGMNLFQEVYGFEKTFLNGNASAGVRMPVLQLDGADSLGRSGVGDLNVVLKYALLNDPAGAGVVSSGLMVTAPTGPDTVLAQGGSPLHPWFLQPFLGGLRNFGDFYVQGFTSVAVPTDFRDVALWFKDVGLGYNLYRNPVAPILNGILPTVEAHVTTPLNHAGFSSQPVGVPATVTFTGGVYFIFRNRASLSLGAAMPVTGPRPTDCAAFGQFNWLF